MVAMMTHVSSQSLRMATNAGDVATPLPPMDWQKADVAERALYNAIEKEMDKFKMTIGWREMQDGLRGEMDFIEPVHKPGTMQLDDFTEEALTDRAPPSLVFEDDKPEPMDTFDVDEEDRIAALEWDAYEAAQDPSEHEPEESNASSRGTSTLEGRTSRCCNGIGSIIQTSHFRRLDERG